MKSIVFQGSFSWILFVVFLVFFLPWCWFTVKSLRAVIFFEKTTGTIQDATYVSADTSSAIPSSPASRIGTYTHQAVFSADNGSTHRVLTRVRSNPPSFAVGDRVRVYYDKQNPSNALIGTFLELWFPPLALSFFVVIFFILWFGTWIGPVNGVPMK